MSLLRVAQSFANLLAAPRSGKPHGTKKVPPPNLDSRLTPVPRLPWDFDAMHMASLDAEGEERESRGGTALGHPHGSGWVLTPNSVPKPPERHEDHARNECALRI